MKKTLFVFAAALFCLAACDKQEVPAFEQDNQEDVYEIVLSTVDTKGSAPSSVELQMGGKVSDYLVATLKKNGQEVYGASYSWSDPKTGNYYSGYSSGDYERQYNISAIKAGSGSYVSVTGYDGGKARATSSNIEVRVTSAPVEPDPVYNYRVSLTIRYPDDQNTQGSFQSTISFPNCRSGFYYITIPDRPHSDDVMVLECSLTGTAKSAETNWTEVGIPDCDMELDPRDAQVTTSSGVAEFDWGILYNSKEVAIYHFAVIAESEEWRYSSWTCLDRL